MAPDMALSSYAISTVGVCLESLLIWRAQDGLLLRRYPFFGAFLVCNLIGALVVLAVALLRPAWFGPTYWTADILSLLAGFLILWEVVRAAFPPGTPLRKLARVVLLTTSLFVVPSALALGWSQANLIPFPYKYVPPVIEQYLTLVEAVLLVAVAVVARYYAIQLGRNLRCLMLGFGLFLSLYAMNFASLQIVQGFLPYWQVLSAVLYIGLLAVWLRAFWEYFPSPERAAMHLDQMQTKEHWNQMWSGATSAVRRRSN